MGEGEEDPEDHGGGGVKIGRLVIVPVSEAGVGHGGMNHDHQSYHEPADIVDEVEAG